MSRSEHEFELIRKMQRQVEAMQPASSSVTQAAEVNTGSSGLVPDHSSVVVPGYDLIRECHRGGQGVVFQAIQKSTRRKVAIKVMKEGPFAGAADRARFDREVQILGALDHPHVVTIHDSGTVAGCHYFVMDYVSGQPLDVFMAGAAHSIRDTLSLFALICEAVNAAHVRGITHRDLKPGNIRVDENGAPRILDFGLAKMAGTDSDAAAMTMTGQFVGSLPWASPEQVEGNPHKIDLRTDVYALGVVLYQMLTGKFPYEVIGPMREVMDRVMHAPPARPRTIRRQIDDEVETIVLKCLQKDRERRYQTAGELGRDVRRYLAGEPIEAKRDSVGYVLRKQLGKHRLAISLALLFVGLVNAGLLSSLVLWRRAAAAEIEQRRERNRADAERDEARAQAGRAEGATRFLRSMLTSVNPGNAHGHRDVTVREMLDGAATQLDAGRLADEPAVEAAVRVAIAYTYYSLGHFPAAESHARTAVDIRRRFSGDQNMDVVEALHLLVITLKEQARFSEAEAAAREALDISRGLDGGASRQMVDSLHNYAVVLDAQGKWAEAQTTYREALDLHRKIFADQRPAAEADIMFSLGSVLSRQQQLPEAGQLAEGALRLHRAAHGDRHPAVAHDLSLWAFVFEAEGKFEEAEPRYREALALRQKLLEDDHPDVAQALNNLAVLLSKNGKLDESERLQREAVAIRRETLGDDHPGLAASLNNLGWLLYTRGRPAEAIPLYHEVLAIAHRCYGDEHPNIASTLNNLGLALQYSGDPTGAAAVFRDAIAMADKLLGAHPLVATMQQNLATLLVSQRRYAEAEALLLSGWATLQTAPAAPVRRGEHLQKLTEFYDAWKTAEPQAGHDASVREWRTRLAEWRASTQPQSLPSNP